MTQSPKTALTTLSPNDAAEQLAQGAAVLVDIREPDEFARRHIPGALSFPVGRLDHTAFSLPADREVIFTCRSGMRTATNASRLAGAVDGQAFILEGGLDAWAAAGLPVRTDHKAPMEIMRQVQLLAGILVLTGVILGFALHPAFFGLSAFVGAGLSFAGATGFCGLARLLAFAPWNRPAALSVPA